MKRGHARGTPCRRCGGDSWIWRRKLSARVRACLLCIRANARSRMAAQRQDPAWALWEAARSRATREGARFSITPSDVRAVWPTDGRCPALGIRLQAGRGTVRDSSPSLDRLNNAWGYESGNIAVLSLAANRAKNTLRARDLTKVADWMRTQGLD